MVALGVGAARQRRDMVRIDEARGDVLAPDGVGHRHDERRAAPVEPAVRGVGPHRLRDVTRSHDGSRRGDQAICHRGQPVLLAAMDVNHVDIPDQRAQPAKVAPVGDGPSSSDQRQGGQPIDALAPGAIDHSRLGPGPAAEGHLVAAPRELSSSGPPSRHRRPSATRHQLRISPHALMERLTVRPNARAEPLLRAGRPASPIARPRPGRRGSSRARARCSPVGRRRSGGRSRRAPRSPGARRLGGR